MLNRIIEFSVRNKLIIGLFILGLIAFGISEVGKLPIDAVPDITDNQVQIITRSPSLGAPDVERLISFPIEQGCRNIPEIKEIRSFSRFGLSVVTIVFKDKADIYWARQQISERLQSIAGEIPESFGKPEIGPVTTGLGEIYQYSVRPKPGYENKYDAMQLRTIQDWIIRPQLLGVEGVADVGSFGGLLKQYEIAINSDRLNAQHLTVSDVYNALQKNNGNTGGAYIERGPTVLFIRSEGLAATLDDIGQIVIKNLPDGAPVLVRDVATVQLGHATRYGAMTWNGKQQVAGAVVMMLKGANSNEVIKNIKEKVASIQKTLPEGVMIDAFLDRTKMVKNAITTVEHNLLEGMAIVLIVLIIFLGNLRAGLLVASVIPLAMLIAIILMNLFGVSGNLMSLGALDFGLIVDGTVIIVEAIMHEIHLGKKAAISNAEMDEEVVKVSSRMRNAAIFGELIILIVYIPIFTLQGIEGKMFKPMAQTVAFALIGAFILSLTYVPVMSSLFLSRKKDNEFNWSDRMMAFFEKHQQRALAHIIKYPKAVIISAAVLFVLAVFTLTKLGGEFIPKLEEGDYAVETRVLTGSNLQTSVDAVSKASKLLLSKYPEVQQVVGKTGSSEIPTDPMPIEASDMMVILKDKSEWKSAKSFDELTEKMSKTLEAIPGVTFGFQYPVQMRFNELMTGARQDVVCKIFGENLDTLAQLSRQLGAIAGGVKGARDIYVEAVTGMPQIVVRYNRVAIAQYGLNIDDVNKVVNAAFAGGTAGTIYDGQKRFDLVVRLSGDQRKQLSDVQNLLIPTPSGNQLPLQQVAAVKIEDGPNQIQREDAQRRIIIGFNVLGRDVQSMVEELQQKVNTRMKMPPGYYITYGGAFENLKAAKDRLSIAVPVSLLLILLMLYLAFGSVKQGLLIFSAVPLSAIGGVLALVIRGMPFSISAGVGFIALFGVAVLNGLVLLSEFNRLKASGLTDIRKIIFEGTKIRLRPVLMTAAVASFGFLPMALSNGAGAEVQRPLATVVIGGLITATFLTLFVLPILYMLMEKRAAKKLNLQVLVILLILSAGMFAGNTKAQTPITLKAAIDTALKNNLSLKSDRLNAAYLKQNSNTFATIPHTQLSGEYGQLNSAYNDTRLSVVQSVNFPTVYTRQKALLNEEYIAGELNVTVKERETKKLVTEAFYRVLYLKQKQALLNRADSTYALFLKNATLRFEKGESNILEKTTAETQRAQILQQTEMVNTDLQVARTRFLALLNATITMEPSGKLRMAPATGSDTGLNRHPQLRYLEQQVEVAKAQTKAEKSKLMPDINLGYYNQSIRGIQNLNGADRFYNGNNRFSSVQLGLAIPILGGAQRSRVSALHINEQRTQADYQTGLQEMHTRYLQANEDVKKFQQLADYYEKAGLANARLILKTAHEQFIGGQINYLEYTLLVNQAISLQNEYLESVNNLNQATIQLNNLKDQN